MWLRPDANAGMFCTLLNLNLMYMIGIERQNRSIKSGKCEAAASRSWIFCRIFFLYSVLIYKFCFCISDNPLLGHPNLVISSAVRFVVFKLESTLLLLSQQKLF